MLLAAAPSFPEDTASAADAFRPVVLVVPRPLGGEGDLPFLRILAGATEIELRRAGLEVLVPEALLSLSGEPTKRLLEEARGAGADFLFVEGYNSKGQMLRLEVEVRRTVDGKSIASAQTSRRIDLRLDEAVGEAIARLLPQLQPDLAEVSRRKREEAATQPPLIAEEPAPTGEEPEGTQPSNPPAEPSPPEAPGDLASAAEGPAVSGAPPQPEPLPAPQEDRPSGRPQPAAPSPPPSRRLEVGAAGAAFFPIAGLDPLFRVGWLASSYLEYRRSLAALSLAYGLYAGYTGLLPAQAGTATYFQSLIPVGLSLRVGTPEKSWLGVHLRVLAGAAVNASPQAKVDQRLTRVLPQAKAGAGLSAALSPRMGVTLDFLYDIMLYLYLKNGALAAEPIMGFEVPSLSVYVRF